MIARRLPLGLVFLAALATGCPDRSVPPPSPPVPLPTVPPGDYFPLAEGMQWKYEVVTPGASFQGTMVLTVTKVTKQGSETEAEGVRTLQLKQSNGVLHGGVAKVTWRKTRTGVYESIEGEADDRQVLALPLKLNGDWAFGTLALTITSFEDMTINGKAYKNALRVRSEDGDRLGYATFARDVGMVSWWGRKLEATGDLQVGFGLLEHVKKDATPPPSPTSDPAGSPSPGASASPTASPSPSSSPSPSASPTASPAP